MTWEGSKKLKKKNLICIICIMALVFSGCGAETVTPAEPAKESEEVIQEETTVPAKEDTEAVEEVTEEIVDITLKEVFAEHGMKVGTCISMNELNKRSMSEIVLDNFNSLTVENAMKPDSAINQAKSKAEGKLVVDFNNEVQSVLKWARENT